MAPKKSEGVSVGTSRGEVLKFRSPAEFFSENKNIAGFDNPGKSLYTTIRELVENSLDACESISVLPEIDISVQELDNVELNRQLGVKTHVRRDTSLFEAASKGGGTKKKGFSGGDGAKAGAGGGAGGEEDGGGGGEDGGAGKKGKGKSSETLYYRVTVRDNGCGMKHEQIPNMLGRVLSGSKYGVRQTRGKFGLGAKMALIWSKQSTGMPVEVRSATAPTRPISACVLDIDIQKNECAATSSDARAATSSDVRAAATSDVRAATSSDVRVAATSDVRAAATSDARAAATSDARLPGTWGGVPACRRAGVPACAVQCAHPCYAC